MAVPPRKINRDPHKCMQVKVIVLKCNSFKTLLLQSRAGVLVPSHSELAVLRWEGTLDDISVLCIYSYDRLWWRWSIERGDTCVVDVRPCWTEQTGCVRRRAALSDLPALPLRVYCAASWWWLSWCRWPSRYLEGKNTEQMCETKNIQYAWCHFDIFKGISAVW